MPFQKGQRTRSETKLFHYVMTYNIIQKRLISDYRHTHSWASVGALYGVSRALAYKVAIQGYEPKDAVLRAKLGYPIFTRVELITSEPAPDGTQILEIRLCVRCNKPFVPNCPSRRVCYLCAPKR